MLHNEDEYPDPSAFKPERFMKDRQLDPNIRDPALMAFGFGRRWEWISSLYIEVVATWTFVETNQKENNILDYALGIT